MSRVLDDAARGRDVVGEVELRPVVHDRAEAPVDREQGELGVLSVIEVHGDGCARGAGDRERRPSDRLEAAVVPDAVLGQLQDHRQPGVLCGAHERLGGLEVQHVERAHAGTRRGGGVEDRASGGERHADSRGSRAVTTTSASRAS